MPMANLYAKDCTDNVASLCFLDVQGSVLAVSNCVGHDGTSVVDEFCLPVKLSPRLSLFAASPNLATSRPRHRVFACLLMAPEGLGDESQWKMSAFGSGLFHENFSRFHPLLPLQKATFVLCLVCPPPSGGLLLSTLVSKWAAPTLTCVLNIVSQYHSNTFHIKILLQQVSVHCRRCRHARCNYLRPGLYSTVLP